MLNLVTCLIAGGVLSTAPPPIVSDGFLPIVQVIDPVVLAPVPEHWSYRAPLTGTEYTITVQFGNKNVTWKASVASVNLKCQKYVPDGQGNLHWVDLAAAEVSSSNGPVNAYANLWKWEIPPSSPYSEVRVGRQTTLVFKDLEQGRVRAFLKQAGFWGDDGIYYELESSVEKEGRCLDFIVKKDEA
jgi:hypothetical protein